MMMRFAALVITVGLLGCNQEPPAGEPLLSISGKSGRSEFEIADPATIALPAIPEKQTAE